MLRHEGNHIGDSWYFVKDGVCHCYYLTCPETVERHTAWDIAHAVSTDLVHWENQGIVFSRDTLLERVWGFDFMGDDRTVDAQIKMLRHALGDYRRFIVTYRGAGYKFEDQ